MPTSIIQSESSHSKSRNLLNTAMACGFIGLCVLLGIFVASKFSPILAQSLIGSEGKGFWDLSRASGMVTYLLFWASIVLGLLMTNKLARAWPGGPTAFKLHEYMCILGLVFALFHATILLGDPFIQLTPSQLLIPFTMHHELSVWVGLGQIGFYLLAAIVGSFYIRQKIGTQVWRWLHFMTFIAFMLITVHGLLAGSDTKTPFMLGLYVLTGSSVFVLMFYRMAKMMENKNT